jgi:hypothetical protein
MCASCGCGKPNDTHGDSRHITVDQVKAAAAAANITPQEAAKNMMQAVQQESGSFAQSNAATADEIR